MLLSLLLLSLSAAAQDVESLTYQLTANGQPVGERTVTITYLQEDTGEVRLLESYTSLAVPLGKETFQFKQRMGGKGRVPAGTFTSALSTSQGPSEVQAIRRSDGWHVTVVEPSRTVQEIVLHRDVDATSLTLVDPGAAGFLSGMTRLSVLSAETGAVLAGPLIAGAETELSLGGQSVPGQTWIWQPDQGSVELIYGREGHLLRYTMQVAGVAVRGELTQAPAGRGYQDSFDIGGLSGGSIGEEEL